MSEMKKKRRLRSVILISAVSAVACGGRAEDNERAPSEKTGGDGDGDGPVIGDPVGDYVGLPVGEPYIGTGGGFIGGTGGTPGGGGFVPGTGGAPGEPPYLGGMGGSSEEFIGDEFIGIPPR